MNITAYSKVINNCLPPQPPPPLRLLIITSISRASTKKKAVWERNNAYTTCEREITHIRHERIIFNNRRLSKCRILTHFFYFSYTSSPLPRLLIFGYFPGPYVFFDSPIIKYITIRLPTILNYYSPLELNICIWKIKLT